MPPKDELLRPFENFSIFWCRRKRVSLEWCIIDGYRLFARPQNAEREIVWSFPMFTPPRQEEREEYVTDFFSQRYCSSFFNRWVLFEYAESVEGIWLLPGFSHYWSGLVRQGAISGVNWKARFDWKGDYPSFVRAPPEFFLQSAQRAVEEDPEEWQRALQWTHLSPDERFWPCVSWKAGNKEEWEALIVALFRLVLPHLPSDASHRWGVFVLKQPRFAFAPLRMKRGVPQKDFPEVVWPLLALLENYFGAMIDYTQVIGIGNLPYARGFYPRPIKALPSSQHELMAALDLWREFGRNSGQLPEVETGLQQLLT